VCQNWAPVSRADAGKSLNRVARRVAKLNRVSLALIGAGQFANEVTATFTMSAFTDDVSRTIKLMGTDGEIRGVLAEQGSEIEVHHFPTRSREALDLQAADGPQGHGGGDAGVMQAFVELVRANDWRNVPTSAAVSVQSHLMAAAAETSRLERRTIEMSEYARGIRSAVSG
jgi:hypothetical protein